MATNQIGTIRSRDCEVRAGKHKMFLIFDLFLFIALFSLFKIGYRFHFENILSDHH